MRRRNSVREYGWRRTAGGEGEGEGLSVYITGRRLDSGSDGPMRSRAGAVVLRRRGRGRERARARRGGRERTGENMMFAR